MFFADCFRLVWTPFLKKTKGRMLQAVGVVCPPVLGIGGELTFYVGGSKYTAGSLIGCPGQPGVQLWLIPRPAKPVRCRVVWKTPQGKVYRDSLTVKPTQPSNVHVVFKTALSSGCADRSKDTLDKLLANLDRTSSRRVGKRFVYTLPTALLEQCLDSNRVPADSCRRLEQYVRTGQVVWSLAPFAAHSEFFGFEEMCRSLYAARRLAERFDQPVPKAAEIADVPAHPASLAMAFVAAGGNFFQICANIESLLPAVPPLFWWKLPDGNRILCHYTSTNSTPLLPPPDWPWGEWLSVQTIGDAPGAQSFKVLGNLDWIEANFDYPVCRTGRLEDFADAVIRRHGKQLREVEEEFVDWQVPGLASQTDATAIARRNKDRLPAAETLQALADFSSERSANKKERAEIEDAYRQLALYAQQTKAGCTCDIRKALPKTNLYKSKALACDDPKSPIDKWVASWKNKADIAYDAERAIERIESRAVSSFAGRKPGSSQNITLFNTLSWSRGGPVRIADSQLPTGGFELIDPTTGGSVLYERRGGFIEFIAPAVPPCGYLSLRIHPVIQRAQPGPDAEWIQRDLSLHTNHYTFRFHPKGGLARWYDRMHSCQWCSDEVEFPMGSYLYEMPGGERLQEFARQVHPSCSDRTVGLFHRSQYEDMPQFGLVGGDKAKISSEITPLYARVIVEAHCPDRKVAQRRSGDIQGYRTTFTKYRSRNDLHINMQLMGKRPTYAAEAGYAYFPFFGEDPFVLVDRIAHLIRPGEDLAGGVNAAHMAVHRGVRIENTHVGMNFFPLQTPLVAFGQPGAYRFDDDGDYSTGVLYATLFNNCSGRNFAQWQSGDYSFDFVLSPTRNDDWDGGMAQGGAEVFRPLLAVIDHGRLNGPSQSLLKIDPPDVQLITLKPAEFESGLVIRMWNADVDPVKARLEFSAVPRGASLLRCDLLERPAGKRIALDSQGSAVVPLKPNEIATLLLKPGEGS